MESIMKNLREVRITECRIPDGTVSTHIVRKYAHTIRQCLKYRTKANSVTILTKKDVTEIKKLLKIMENGGPVY